jgi:hypothetical protein
MSKGTFSVRAIGIALLAVVVAYGLSMQIASRDADEEQAAQEPERTEQTEYEVRADYADGCEWHAIADFLRAFGERDGRPMRRYFQNGTMSVIFHTDDAKVTVSQVTDERLILVLEPFEGSKLAEIRPTLASALSIAAPGIADSVLEAFDAGGPSELRDGVEFASIEPASAEPALDGGRGKVTVVRDSR